MNNIFYKIQYIFNRTSNREINYNELKNIMNNSNKSYLIDVRSNQEFREGHLLSAINLPVYDLAKKIQYNVNNKGDIIILYCQSNSRSRRAKRILEKIGYVNVYILRDGIDGVRRSI